MKEFKTKIKSLIFIFPQFLKSKPLKISKQSISSKFNFVAILVKNSFKLSEFDVYKPIENMNSEGVVRYLFFK